MCVFLTAIIITGCKSSYVDNKKENPLGTTSGQVNLEEDETTDTQDETDESETTETEEEDLKSFSMSAQISVYCLDEEEAWVDAYWNRANIKENTNEFVAKLHCSPDKSLGWSKIPVRLYVVDNGNLIPFTMENGEEKLFHDIEYEVEEFSNIQISIDYCVIGGLKKKKEYVSEQYEKVMINTVKKSAISMGRADSFFEKEFYEIHISTYNTWVDVVEVNERGIESFHFKIFHEATAGMVLILWCVALSVQVVDFEEHKNLKLMVSLVYRGRKENLLSKIAAVAIIVAVVKMSMVLLTILQGPIFYGVSFRTLFAPIQSLERYQMCNFHVSFMGFFLLVGLGQLVLLELVVCVTSVLSYFTKTIPAECEEDLE